MNTKQDPWATWQAKADESDADPYRQAKDPAYVCGALKTAEGRCDIDIVTAHQEIALAPLLGMARKTLDQHARFVEMIWARVCSDTSPFEVSDIQADLDACGLLIPLPLEPGQSVEDEQYRVASVEEEG